MSSSTTNFESAISLTGYGKFHYNLFACCAMCLLATGFQNGMSAYVLPAAQCDLNLSSAEMGFLNVAFLLGGIASAFLWGLLADILGRRVVMITTLISDFLTTLAAGLSQNYSVFVLFRFLNGFFIGAPGTLVFSYLAEFHSKEKQTKCICYVGFFFTLAWVLLPAIAWIIIPLQVKFHSSYFIFNSWKLFVLCLSLPSLFGGIWLVNLPESPKFLLIRGESKHALAILRRMFSENNGRSPDEYPVKFLLSEEGIIKKIPKEVSGPVGSGRTIRLLKEMRRQIKFLFQPPLLSLTTLTSLMLFTNMFGYYGLGLWLPEIFSRFEDLSLVYPNDIFTLCDLPPSNETSLNVTFSLNCSNPISGSVFFNTVVIGFCCLLGNIVSGYLAGKTDRRILPVSTMFLAGICAIVMYFLSSSLQHLLVASVFQAAMSTSCMTLNSVVVELFPTAVSAMAICTATLAGRMGAGISNLAFGLLLDHSCEIPIFIVAAILITGGILGLFIPSKKSTEQNDQDLHRANISIICTE